MQDFLKVGNTHQHSAREHNISRTTQASFLAKCKTTQHKLGQKGHCHSVYMIYIYIYIIIYYKYIYIYYIYIYIYIYILHI